MNKDTIKKKLINIFKEVFDNDKIKINDNSNAKNIKNWDSFIQMNLILSIESKFNLSFSSREVEKLKNVGDMISLIYKKLNE